VRGGKAVLCQLDGNGVHGFLAKLHTGWSHTSTSCTITLTLNPPGTPYRTRAKEQSVAAPAIFTPDTAPRHSVATALANSPLHRINTLDIYFAAYTQSWPKDQTTTTSSRWGCRVYACIM